METIDYITTPAYYYTYLVPVYLPFRKSYIVYVDLKILFYI